MGYFAAGFALAARPDDERITESVRVAVLAFPYDVQAVTQIAAMRTDALDPDRIVRHIRQVEADFAEAVAERLARRRDAGGPAARSTSERLAVAVTARCVAAAVFGAMEVWMVQDERSLAELAELCGSALASIERGMVDGLFRR